jgi:hypothetical protein
MTGENELFKEGINDEDVTVTRTKLQTRTGPLLTPTPNTYSPEMVDTGIAIVA